MGVPWARFEQEDPELAAFGRARMEGRIAYLSTLRPDGAPRVHPVSPWFGAGLLMVMFRGHSPKVREVARDGRYAMHSASPAGDHDGEAGEFLVRGWLESVGPGHPASVASPYGTDAPYPLAYFTCHVEEVVATTYEGDRPIYHRWRG